MANSSSRPNSIDDTVDEEVELGFLEKTPTEKLQSHLFPCKFGGKPAWLSLKPLPSTDDLLCPKCSELCVFLLQVFAPQNDIKHCFHRTIFVFMCQNAACYKANDSSTFIVFRCQLPRQNKFYSSEPPDEEKRVADPPHAGKQNPLCIVCGCLGDKKCAQCTKAYYCSKTHQTMDWKFHKKLCKELREHPEEKAVIVESDTSINFLFPEYEIVIEPENYIRENAERSEEERLAEYKSFLSSQSIDGPLNTKEAGIETELLEKSARAQEDKMFRSFQERLKHEPEQVIRYQRGGVPLWAASTGLVGAVPPCELCGAARVFEFQVMPQLLRYMGVDAATPVTATAATAASTATTGIDWATLVIYTCRDNCALGAPYKTEFAWKQDYSST